MLDTVTDELKKQVYQRAQGACECANVMGRCAHHHPPGRCANSLGYSWKIQPKEAEGPITTTNLIALCEQCYRNTPAFQKTRGW
jgi:hypothetical protein